MLPTLLGAEPLPRLVLLSPFSLDTRFLAHLTRGGVRHEDLLPAAPTALERILDSICSERYLRTSGLIAPRLQRDRARWQRYPPTPGSLLRAKDALARLPLPHGSWQAVLRAFGWRRPYRALFEQYRPDLLVTSTAGFHTAEVPLIIEAQRQRVPRIGVDVGWDNLSSKYRPLLRMTRLLVWNRVMQDEAIRYHGYVPGRVGVTGAPQFDEYFRWANGPSREAFLSRIGADPSRRLITLATAGEGTHGAPDAIVRVLAGALVDGRIRQPAQLLVRLHPRDSRERYRAVEALPHVTIEQPFQVLRARAGFSLSDATAPTREQRTHLAATLAHSDLIINFASTTTIEACIFDTPVVNIGFDGRDGLPLPLSIRRYFHYEHYQPVLREGAVRVANTPSEMIGLANAYLADPSLDRVARRRLVVQLAGFTDGASGRRVGQEIVDMVRPAQAAGIATS